ncbi:MAG: DUF4221 domain-containing protein [Prevotellaceae bacterium]|nr:DUF4221 domain-containing protein [Prevotellaceae bacterium]
MKTISNLRHVSIITIIFLIFESCGNNNENIIHAGEKRTSISIVIDSMIIDATYTSGQGNFYMKDSIITFADTYYSTFFHYDINTGKYISKHFSRGNGPNELNKFMCAYPALNGKQVFILDASNYLLSFDEQFNISKHGTVNFGWSKNQQSSDFESPTNYNVMQMTDFGIHFTYLNDSILIIPVNIVKRFTSRHGLIHRNHYKRGHIFGKLNINNMKVEKIFGQFPEIYKKSPTPHLEFFQYAVKGDTMYVNHAVDSLIYVYEYPDRLLYTMGYECNNINRKYTITTIVDEGRIFMDDKKKAEINTGLKYIPQTNLLIRTYMKFIRGESGLQVYENSHLIGDFEMPPYFIFLGYYNGVYYGVRIIPIETEDKTEFVFYKLIVK